MDDNDIDFISKRVDNISSTNYDNEEKEFLENQKLVLNNRKDRIYDNTNSFSYNKNYSNNPLQNFDPTFFEKSKIKNDTNDRNFDPYINFLYKKGIIKKSDNINYQTYYINIDSSLRRIIPTISTLEPILLEKDPLQFISTTNTLKVKLPKNHNFSINDKITLSGLKYVKRKIKSFTYYTNTNNARIKRYYFDIVRDINTKNFEWLRIDINLNIDVDRINLLTSTLFDYNEYLISQQVTSNISDKEFDLEYDSLYVQIDGFTNDNGTTKIGNIPINLLNTRHKVYLAPRTQKKSLDYTTETSSSIVFDRLGQKIKGITDLIDTHPDDASTRSFYIKLPYVFEGSIDDLASFNIDVKFDYYGGVPINEINAEYPISNSNKIGFHEIESVENESITIKMPNNAYFNENFGGNNIYISKIIENISGYQNPNEYELDLGKNFTNIIQSRLISTEFPNTEKVFTSKNNKIYWQNLSDGDIIYSASITEGNYTSDDLSNELFNQIYKIPRITSDLITSSTSTSTGYATTSSNTTSVYTNNNYIQVNINTKTDVCIFNSYREAIINKPFISVTPNIPEGTDVFTDTSVDGTYELLVNHPQHDLSIGDDIVIRSAVDYLGIEDNKINTTHKIQSIVSDDSYTIKVSNINIQQIRVNSFGGNGVNFLIPNKFRLRFDYSDSVGPNLGFRDCGKLSSITSYNTTISNTDSYYQELDVDESGNKKIIKNNSLKLSGENYVLMSIAELNNMYNLGKIKDVYSKINLTGLPGKILYNSFIPNNNFYYNPIKNLTKLSISYYSSNGELFDFNGLDHSFTLELVTLDIIPEGTNINES